MAANGYSWKERGFSERGNKKVHADKIPYKYRIYVDKTKKESLKQKIKVRTFFRGGRRYSLKYRINKNWRKLVTGGRKHVHQAEEKLHMEKQ